jgi:hypothetical protein
LSVPYYSRDSGANQRGYGYHRNEFRVLALGQNKLKVQFNGEWMTRGGYPNIGEASGEATIPGNVATLSPGIPLGARSL